MDLSTLNLNGPWSFHMQVFWCMVKSKVNSLTPAFLSKRASPATSSWAVNCEGKLGGCWSVGCVTETILIAQIAMPELNKAWDFADLCIVVTEKYIRSIYCRYGKIDLMHIST